MAYAKAVSRSAGGTDDGQTDRRAFRGLQAWLVTPGGWGQVGLPSLTSQVSLLPAEVQIRGFRLLCSQPTASVNYRLCDHKNH